MMTFRTFNIPSEPFLAKIFQLWQESPKRTLIRDLSHERHPEHSVEEFLYDVSIVRQQLYDGMSVEKQEQLRNPDSDVFIGILASSEYACAVFVFAIYCLGCVAVPMSPNLQPEEAKYFIQISDAVLLMATPAYEQHAQAICDLVGNIKPFIFDSTKQSPNRLENVSFSLDTKTPPINPEKGFVVLLTSGTTGPAKGALHSRRSVKIGLSTQIAAFALTPNDTWLHYHPTHWMGGFMYMMANLVTGSCIEFCSSKMNHDWLLKRLQTDDSICLSLGPPKLDAIAEKLEGMKESDQSAYENAVKGLCGIRILCSGAMTVGASTQATWREIRGGKPVTTLYGMTESLGMIAINAAPGKGGVDGSLASAGVQQPHATIKIDDESGEIRVKSQALFTRYISSHADATKVAFDAEGFYKTGDVGKLDNDILYVLGRASQDTIFTESYKIYAPEIEEALNGHPLISRSIVVGVSDPIHNQLVAALLVPRSMCKKSSLSLSLEALRKWVALDRGLNMYKAPTLLRIVGPNEDVPVTITNKPIKAKIRDSFFNEGEIASGKVEAWDFAVIEEFGQRPFDWGGIQV